MKDPRDLQDLTIHDVNLYATNKLQDGGIHFATLLTITSSTPCLMAGAARSAAGADVCQGRRAPQGAPEPWTHLCGWGWVFRFLGSSRWVRVQAHQGVPWTTEVGTRGNSRESEHGGCLTPTRGFAHDSGMVHKQRRSGSPQGPLFRAPQ